MGHRPGGGRDQSGTQTYDDQAAAVGIKGRNVLCHGAGEYDLEEPVVGANASDNAVLDIGPIVLEEVDGSSEARGADACHVIGRTTSARTCSGTRRSQRTVTTGLVQVVYLSYWLRFLNWSLL